jgi:hypothetical protein
MSDVTLGFYDYINRMDKQNILFYVTLISFVLFFATTIFVIKIQHIAGLVLGIVLVLFLNDKEESSIQTFNQEMEFKLIAIKNTIANSKERVPKTNVRVGMPQYFHTDADLINLYFNVIDFQKYNPYAYEKSIQAADSVLKIHEDLKKGVKNCAENKEVMDKLANDSLNYFQTFIYVLPSNPVTDIKLNNNLKRLQLLLRRHLDDAYRLCERQYKKLGWSIDRKVISNSGPRPNDVSSKDFNIAFDLFV